MFKGRDAQIQGYTDMAVDDGGITTGIPAAHSQASDMAYGKAIGSSFQYRLGPKNDFGPSSLPLLESVLAAVHNGVLISGFQSSRSAKRSAGKARQSQNSGDARILRVFMDPGQLC